MWAPIMLSPTTRNAKQPGAPFQGMLPSWSSKAKFGRPARTAPRMGICPGRAAVTVARLAPLVPVARSFPDSFMLFR